MTESLSGHWRYSSSTACSMINLNYGMASTLLPAAGGISQVGDQRKAFSHAPLVNHVLSLLI
jgi:hypothetical protein